MPYVVRIETIHCEMGLIKTCTIIPYGSLPVEKQHYKLAKLAVGIFREADEKAKSLITVFLLRLCVYAEFIDNLKAERCLECIERAVKREIFLSLDTLKLHHTSAKSRFMFRQQTTFIRFLPYMLIKFYAV